MKEPYFLLIICISVFLCSTVFGSSFIKNITASIDERISVIFDGKQFEPIEQDGTRVRPLIYNNRIYLPAKAIGEKAGLSINWNSETKTLIINSSKEVNGEKDKNIPLVLKYGLAENQLNMEQDGRAILTENASTGYQWFFTISNPDVIKFKSKEKISTVEPAATSESSVGKPDEYIWNFTPLKPGDCKITFKYYRPFEGEEKSAKIYEYTVKVKNNK